MEEFKPNSKKSKEESFETRVKLEPVVVNPIKAKKKSAFERFLTNFLTEDLPRLKDYLLHDLLIPAAKNVVQTVINTSVDTFLYGNRGMDRERDRRGYGSYGGYSSIPASRYSYASYYDRRAPYDDRDDRDRRYERSTLNWDEIPYNSKEEAERVLDRLKESYDTYHRACVLDLFDLSGRTGERSDYNYGWPGMDILNKGYSYQRGRYYYIYLPRPMPLNPNGDRD